MSQELLHGLSLFSLQVLVTRLTERGFLFLLSSVQMATPTGMTGVLGNYMVKIDETEK